VTHDHDALFWRSRARNPVNHWYEKLADGYHRQGNWKIFWWGVPSARIPDVIDFSLRQEEDFGTPVQAT